MSTRKKIAAATILAIGGVAICFAAVRLMMNSIAAAHQRSVTHSIAEWGEKHSSIEDDNDAWRAIGMLEYIRDYYVVGPGYRSDAETEERLESQRAETIRTISAALDDYINTQANESAERLKNAKAKVLDGASSAVGQP